MTNNVKNFGIVAGLTIGRQGKTPTARFRLKNGDKFDRACIVYGGEKVDAMKKLGDGADLWVRGQIVSMKDRSGKFAEDTLKVFNIVDRAARRAEEAAKKAEAAEAGEAGETADAEGQTDTVAAETEGEVAETTAAETAEQREIDDEIPF